VAYVPPPRQTASVSGTATAAARVAPWHGSRWHRFLKIGIWLIGIAIFLEILQLLGVDVKGWLSSLWDQIKAVPVKYVILALILQTGQTLFTGLSYYGIVSYAYPGEATVWPILTAYAVGVAMNGFLPANIGTFVTLLMFIAIIPSMNFSGATAAYLVQKIFFTVVGAFVYLYMFLSVPGAFSLNFSNEKNHPVAFLLIVAGGIFLILLLVRMFWPRVKKFWQGMKKGGAILSEPRKYLTRAALPSLLGYFCKMGVIAVFLAAFAIPVTFDSIMWVIGSGSLANVVSFTPGAVGITQATNALALKTCCQVPNNTAVAYSTAQQLITTGWNVLLAIVMVVAVFGWTGGKLLVGGAYADAKVKVAEAKEQRKEKHDEKVAAKKKEKEEKKGG
jgi:uncharacterized membrane protein YbhN (UPF0104 family)